MPLRSRLFAGSRELQACLTTDSAHVVPGAQGEHVALIQSALVRFRFLSAENARSEARSYGPHTTAAVLAYKEEHKIINRSYQSQADNIVGRMTIASLDHGISILDDLIGGPRRAAPPGPHPKSPTPTVGSGVPNRQPVVARAVTGAAAPLTTVTGAGAFGPPLSTLPDDIQAVIRRSNDAKVPGVDLLVPFLEAGDGPLSAAELTKRFAGGHSVRIPILTALHARMAPFGLWPNIRIIREVYTGKDSSSLGIFCEPFDHEAFMRQMIRLTTGTERFPPSVGGPIAIPITDSRFCKDLANVHGARDSFREIVKQGPGLHMCIAKPAVRSTLSCDLHIDAIQQGSVCSKGFCIPLANGQTIQHLRTVGPWLVRKAGELVQKI
ncbi:MAG TPA: hypothetical protein VIT67_10145 [Povalibacter sp.]